MPSKKLKTAALPSQRQSRAYDQSLSYLFWPLVVISLMLWFVYRTLFHFPVWFDESIGKAIFFGLPVWVYATITRNLAMADTFSPLKLKKGLLQGIAFGGVYGFVASVLALMVRGGQVQAAPLFSSGLFWGEFLLSLLTGFWETLFFFSWIMIALEQLNKNWSLAKLVLVTAGLFLIFHAPNAFLRFSPRDAMIQLLLLFMFGIGQALLFKYRHNGYALAISHAIWGMVLLVHLS